jgi:hypothetical protein
VRCRLFFYILSDSVVNSFLGSPKWNWLPYSFADDFLLYREINNENDQNTLQKDLQNLEKWATNWGMRFNAKKMLYAKSQKEKKSYFGGYCIWEIINVIS